MKKRLFALLMAGVLVFSTGCSVNISFDPNTGSITLDTVQSDKSAEDKGSEDSDEKADEDAKAEDADEETDEDAKEEDADEETDEDFKEDDTDEEVTSNDEEESPDDVEECAGGIRIRYPDAFMNSKGVINCNSFEMDEEEGVYVTYFYYVGLSEEWLVDHLSMDDPAPEDLKKFSDSEANFTYIITIDNNRGLDDLAEIVSSLSDDDDFDEKDYTRIAKCKDCTFYRYTGSDKEGAENLDDGFREEFDTLYDMFDDILENAEYFKPVEPYEDIIGKKISFETTDIDGNPVTSDEIFSQNKVTMINVWATWCYWCVDELPELNRINDRLAKKDCAVVGLVGDGTDRDTIADAKKLLKENGDEYLNILPWDDALTDDFPMSKGGPTTFFVDSEGRIAARPVVGANIEKYEKVVDEILDGKVSEPLSRRPAEE